MVSDNDSLIKRDIFSENNSDADLKRFRPHCELHLLSLQFLSWVIHAIMFDKKTAPAQWAIYVITSYCKKVYLEKGPNFFFVFCYSLKNN